MLFEGAVAATADDPDVAGAQPAAQLRQHAELVITAVDLTAGHHMASPSLADEAGRRGFRQLEHPGSVHVAQCVDRAQQRGGGRDTLKGEGGEKRRRPAPHRAVVLAQPLVGIEVIRARQRFRCGDAGAKTRPWDDGGDRLERVAPGLARRDQGTDTGIETHPLVDGASIGLKGAGMPRLSLGEHCADEPLEQIDRLVGQSGAELKCDSDQAGVAALPLIAGNMLGRRPPGFTGKLGQAGLMHAMPARGVDAGRPYMVQALYQTEHRGRLGRLGHLAQPAEPALPAFRPALRQRIQPPALLGGQSVGQPALDLAPRSKAEINTETFETPRRRNDDPPPATFFHDQLGQVEEAIVLDGLRMKGVGELRRRAFSEGAQPKPLLAFNGVSLPVPFRPEIRLERPRKSVNLLCHEGRQLCRRLLTGSQRTTRIA